MTATETNELFERLYSEFSPRVYAYMKLCAGKEDASDLTQTVFLRLWTWLSEGNVPNEPKAWIFRTAVNVRADEMRAKYRRPAPAELTEESAVDENAEVNITESEAVTRAMSMLCDSDRELLTLRGMGFDSEETGRVFGITASAARTRMQKAKTNLKKALEKCGVNIDG